MTTPHSEIRLQHGRLLIIGSGALGVSLLPGWVLYLRSHLALKVRVALTPTATTLVSPQALAALSGQPVLTGTARTGEQGVLQGSTVPHREAAEWPDLVLFAPATGNSVAKIALGLADNLALTVWSFSPAPRVVVPSFTEIVADRPLTQRHVSSLRGDGVHVMDGAAGYSPFRDGQDASAMPNIIQVLDFIARIPELTQRSQMAEPTQGVR